MFKKFLLYLSLFLSLISIANSIIYINNCTATQNLVSNETYLVQNSINTTVKCFDINQASNITLDCQGYNLTGDSGDIGLQIFGASSRNIRVNNCNFINFSGAFHIQYGSYSNFTNITTSNTRDLSLYMDPSTIENRFSNIIIDKGAKITRVSGNIYFDNVSDGNGKYVYYFSNTTVNIDGWTNISSLNVHNVSSCIIKNLNFVGKGTSSNFLYLERSSCNIENVSLQNYSNAIEIYNSLNNTLSNLNLYNSSSGLVIQNTNNNIISNISITNNTNYGIRVDLSSNNTLNNVYIFNNLYGIFASSFFNNILNNITIINSTSQGFYLSGNVDNNTILNSTMLNNNLYNVYFSEGGANKPENNTFYNNYLGNISKLYSNNWSNINYFNYTLPSGLVIGNYWNNLSCLSYTINGSYEICTNPANYTLNSTNSIYDFAPLVYPIVSANYSVGPSGNYYSESIYIEVNSTKNISSCVLYFNETPTVMSVNNNICYTTASGSFGNSYDYNVSVIAVNTAANTTTTNTINLLDISINYVSPPTPLNNVKKYALENITIQISDNGGSFDNCIVQIEDVNYSMTYSGGNCSYIYIIPDFNRTTSVTFQGFYNVSGTVSALEERTVTIYESQTNQNKIPAFGLNSIILFILTIIGGILFN